MYSKRSQPQQVTAVHQYLGTRTASVGSWPGTARTAFHAEKLVKIACKEVVNPHKTDHLQSPPTRFELCLQQRKFIGTVDGSRIRRLQLHLLKLVATIYIILYISGG